MLKKLLPVIVMGALLVGCGGKSDNGPKIDGSSFESFEKSSKLVAESLKTDDEKRKFAEAMVKVGMTVALEGNTSQEQIQNAILKKLDKKSAKEIISEYAK